jgi:hypothetical protein
MRILTCKSDAPTLSELPTEPWTMSACAAGEPREHWLVQGAGHAQSLVHAADSYAYVLGRMPRQMMRFFVHDGKH